MGSVGEKSRVNPVRMLGVAFAHLQDIPPTEESYLQTTAWRLVFEHGGQAMSSKAELARIAQTRLTPIEEVAAELAQVIRENTEGQPAGRTPREQLLAGRAQELGSNLLHLLDEAAQSDNT